MRAKNKEIFKKERLPPDDQDMDCLDDTEETYLVKQEKHDHHHKVRKSSRHRRNKHDQDQVNDSVKTQDGLRHKRRREKTRILCGQSDVGSKVDKMHQRNSLITKNRLTRYVGIYNKAKKSETIYREQRKSRFFNKMSSDIKERTDEDMSKVLDCSSFQIRPLQVLSSDAMMDCFKHQDPGPSSYHKGNKEHDKPENIEVQSTPGSIASTSTSNKEITNEDSPFINLPQKAPLMNITCRLINSLEPRETFQRDCLQEIRNELKTYYRRSSSLVGHPEREVQPPMSASVNPVVTPVRIGNRSESSKRLFMSSINKIECLSRQNIDIDRCGEPTISRSETMDIREEKVPLSDTGAAVAQEYRHEPYQTKDKSQFISQNRQRHFQPLSTGQELTFLEAINKTNDRGREPCDILSITEHDLRCTDEIGFLDFQSPVYSEISPLKKPSLEIPSPPGKLYPRKLF